MSKKFTNTQHRYFAYELEALRVLEALMRWQDNLMGGHEFTVIMDHEALEYFKAKNHNSGRHLRWQAFFASFNCEIKYMEGRKNKVADTLSQYYDSSTDEDLHFDDYVLADIHLDKNAEDIIPNRVEEYKELLLSSTLSENSEKKRLAAISGRNNLEEALGGSTQNLEEVILPEENLQKQFKEKDLIEAIKSGYKSSQIYWEILENPGNFKDFSIKDGLITRLGEGGTTQIVVPKGNYKRKSIQGIILENIHKILGHLESKKTVEILRRYFWWKSMRKDTHKFCRSCGTCRTMKKSTRRIPRLLHPLLTLDTPWLSIAMDFTGPFPMSLGYDYLWVIICRLTSNVHLIPIKTTMNAVELAFVFLCEVVRLHRLPHSIISDRDSKFTSKFWHELHQILGVQLKFMTAFHLQGDGQAERMIQKVVQILCARVRPDQCDWAAKLTMAEFTINASSNTSTGFAPFKLIYDHMPKMCLTAPPSDYPGVNDFAQKARDNLMAAHDAIIHNHAAQTIQVNKKRCLDLPLKKGKLAYLSMDKLNLPKGRAGKLKPLYIGPYEILEIFPETSNYVLKLPPQLEQHGIHPRFHVSWLTPHKPNDKEIFPNREANIFYDFREDPDHEAVVHEILNHVWVHNELWFKVKWELGDTTWEPLENCNNLIHLDEYLTLQNVREPENLPIKEDRELSASLCPQKRRQKK